MITIIDNTKQSISHNPGLGELYRRSDGRFNNTCYMVTSAYYDGVRHYSLTNMSTGFSYAGATIDINRIFGDFSDKFYKITEGVRLIIG